MKRYVFAIMIFASVPAYGGNAHIGASVTDCNPGCVLLSYETTPVKIYALEIWEGQ